MLGWKSRYFGLRCRSVRSSACHTHTGRWLRTKKPNILVIMGDDVGWFNHRRLSPVEHVGTGKTPIFDKLASEGMMFTDYYAEASCTARPRELHHRRTAAAHRYDDRWASGSRRRVAGRGGPLATVLKAQGYETGSSARTTSAT